jgi:threonine/homoserine/homoserine lactone efflux protein
MFGIHDFAAFVGAGLLLNISPGPDNLYIVSRSVTQGRRAGLLSALGTGSGCLVHTTAAAFGLSTILALSSLAFDIVKYAGAAYLVYLGVRALVAKPRDAGLLRIDPGSGGSWAVYRQGAVTNILNPKVALFFLAFLPQFIDVHAGYGVLPFLILGGVFVFNGTIWCLLLALAAALAADTLRRIPRLAGALDRASGVVMIALGLNLLRAKLAGS